MNILIISDTHKNHKNLDKVLKKIGKMDMLIHLGDVEGGEDYIEAVAECPVQIVAGNNDFFSQLDREKEFLIGKYHVFITHGQYYYVSMNTERIKEEARARKADIVMFGHTHKPHLEVEEDLITLNPGSISYPRQEGRCPSYMLMKLDQNGKADVTLHYV